MKQFFPPLTLVGLLALPLQAQDLGTEAQREAGRALYMDKCAQCHGDNGDGAGVAAAYFKPAPRDFTTATYKFRTTESGELPTNSDVHRSIRNGMPYSGMPAWPNLSDTEVNNLVYYLKTFSDDFAGPFGSPEAIDIPKPPKITDASIARGREVFLENQCADCHGDLGRGDGKSAPTLTDQWDIHIKPADLTKRWTYRGGSTREDIYRTFTTGLDGSPMPSYAIDPPEDQWNLVNYVYALSRDEAEYATAVVATGTDAAIDLSAGDALFENAEMAYFPVVGQVIEPGRGFFPGVNGVEVRAVYNADDIAIQLAWHDMSAETQGTNGPGMEVAPVGSGEPLVDTTGTYSDAVAIQLPSSMPDGSVLPYMMFGDTKNTVDVWFVDLATNNPQRFEGRGSTALTETGAGFEVTTAYADGRWAVAFKRPRSPEDRLSFDEGAFVPIAFSIWDGFHMERGNKRGLTGWYYLYLEPLERESPVLPMAQYGLLTLFIGIGIVFLVKRRHKAGGFSATLAQA